MSKKLISAVRGTFEAEFGLKPLLVFSPGRINLIGEHTDYNDGFVFPAAINKGIAFGIGKQGGSKCKVLALDLNEWLEFDLQLLERIENGGWRNYILGVVSEIQKVGKELSGFVGVFSGNIPSGSGMSSSAALENSTVFAINKCFNLGLSKKEMIVISQKAEQSFAQVNCGIMDQFASMFGLKNNALLLDCRSLESKAYELGLGEYTIMLVNTNVKHDLSESAYNDRRQVCEMVATQLQQPTLRDVLRTDLNRIADRITTADYQKVLFVLEENERVLSFASAIEDKDLYRMGQLMFDSHYGLRDKYQVSCAELDFLVDQAKEHPAIIGSRMMGGGFGGCTINLVKKSQLSEVKEHLKSAYKNQFGKACSIYKVKLSEGTRIINL